jgi:hypothetical protein
MADKRIHDLTVTTSVTDADNEWIGLDGSGDGSSTNSYKAINFSNFADAISADQNNANDDSAILTNKKIDADDNTISNIANSEIKTAAGIDASKIADGSVSNTEFQYLDGVTSNIQDQIDNITGTEQTYHAGVFFTATSTEASSGKKIDYTDILTAAGVPTSGYMIDGAIVFQLYEKTSGYTLVTSNYAIKHLTTASKIRIDDITILAAALTDGNDYFWSATFTIFEVA